VGKEDVDGERFRTDPQEKPCGKAEHSFDRQGAEAIPQIRAASLSEDEVANAPGHNR
jgi:hypothetical protein